MRRSIGILLVVMAAAGVCTGGNPEGWATVGSTSFSSAIVVQNMSNETAHVQITYPTPCDPTTPDYQVTLEPWACSTVNVNDVQPGPWLGAAVVTSDMPIIAQRSMVWSDPRSCVQKAAGTHGVHEPATMWYLPEGNTWGGFDTSIVIQNVNDAPVNVAPTFITDVSKHPGPTVTVEPFTTSAIHVKETLPDWSSFSTALISSGPVIAQATMMWSNGRSTQDILGVQAPSTMWYLAEGSTSGGFETWYAIQNPNTESVTVSVDFYSSDGQVPGPTVVVDPMARKTVYAADSLPDTFGFSAVVTASAPVVACQTTTWDGHHGASVMPGVPAPSPQWAFVDSSNAHGRSTWFSVWNVGDETADVSITYQPVDGSRQDGTALALDPYGSKSVSLSGFTPSGFTGSVVITSDVPVVAVQGTAWQCGDDTHRDVQFGVWEGSTTWYLPAVPSEPPLWMSTEQPAPGPDLSDRDGDGVPDDEDYCPDWPGDPSTNGC